jgi:hypothetical protein
MIIFLHHVGQQMCVLLLLGFEQPDHHHLCFSCQSADFIMAKAEALSPASWSCMS